MNSTRKEHHDAKKMKKRRKIQPTLETFFPPKKVPFTHTYDRQHNSFLVSLSDDLLHKGIFTFLSVQDLTDLGSTCHFMALRIDEYRGPLPYVIRQELMPKKIVYKNLDDMEDDLQGYPGPTDRVEVSQAQTYRFLLKTKRHHIVQVHVRLSYTLWEESFDRPDWAMGFNMRDVRENPSILNIWEYNVTFPQNAYQTLISTTIIQKSKYKDGSVHQSELFKLDWRSCYLKTLDDAIEEFRQQQADRDKVYFCCWDSIKILPSSKHIEDDLHDCVFYYWICANQAICMTPKLCPSIHYFMRRTKFVPLLHQCWPKEYKEDLTKVHQDREIFAPWPYITPKSQNQWESHAFGEHEIHEIPWYRKWYPKPIFFDATNVFGCIPNSLAANSLLPYLSSSDKQSLFAASPKLRYSGNPYSRPS